MNQRVSCRSSARAVAARVDHVAQDQSVTAPPMSASAITEEAIRRLVDTFYVKVRADSELGPIFDREIAGDWDAHLATMRGLLLEIDDAVAGRPDGDDLVEEMLSLGSVVRAGDGTLTEPPSPLALG